MLRPVQVHGYSTGLSRTLTPTPPAVYPVAQVSTEDYVKIAGDLGMAQIRSDDWSAAVAPFWPAVWRSALSWQGFKGLLKTIRSGLETIKGARAVLLMIKGFNKQIIRLGLVTFVKL